MSTIGSGQLSKMRVRLDEPVSYALPLGDKEVDMNPLLGKKITLRFSGIITCVHCGRKTAKSFNQGYCYRCFQRLAQCDSCVMSPEKCHYEAGTCREPVWGEIFCMQDHIVYLANSSEVKVGITRASQVPTRWIDQGAVQGLPVLRVRSRQQSGFAEAMFRQHVTDKTNWRDMLQREPPAVNLEARKDQLLAACGKELDELQQRFGRHDIGVLAGMETVAISYPVRHYPKKIISLGFGQNSREVAGTLTGIKGQYLILDTGVINIRKYTGYEVALETQEKI